LIQIKRSLRMEYTGGRQARQGVDECVESTTSRAKAPRAPCEHTRAQGRTDASRTGRAHAGAECAGRALAELKAACHRHAGPSSRPRKGEQAAAAPNKGATTTPAGQPPARSTREGSGGGTAGPPNGPKAGEGAAGPPGELGGDKKIKGFPFLNLFSR
jgi:hypothetical protein